MSGRGTRTIGELAQFVTSKNAGPFLLTLDIIFADEATYRTFKAVKPLDRHVIAGLYGIPETARSRCGARWARARSARPMSMAPSSTFRSFRHEGRMDGTNLHLVHSKLSELLAFRRTVALARAMSAAIYFVHTSAREGVETIGEARADGLPVYGETLHQYACFNAEYYKTPRGFCSHTYPSLKFPEDQARSVRILGRTDRPSEACV